MVEPLRRLHVTTGNSTLDLALGGGAPGGKLLLFLGDEGAGSIELAFSVLRAAKGGAFGRATFLTALRSGERAHEEAADLFEGAEHVRDVDFAAFRTLDGFWEHVKAMSDAGGERVVVIESASTFTRFASEADLVGSMGTIAEMAHSAGWLVVVLAAAGSLPPRIEALLAEAADGVLRFHWREGSTSRRRMLTIQKMRGLVPALDGEEIPHFEIALRRGRGFGISQVTNVV